MEFVMRPKNVPSIDAATVALYEQVLVAAAWSVYSLH